MRQYFETAFIVTKNRFQIWNRKAGGNWERFVDNNNFAEQYGPYAK